MITKVTGENFKAFSISNKYILILCDATKEWQVTNIPAVLYIWNDIAFPMKSAKIGNHKIKEHVVNVLSEIELRKIGYDITELN